MFHYLLIHDVVQEIQDFLPQIFSKKKKKKFVFPYLRGPYKVSLLNGSVLSNNLSFTRVFLPHLLPYTSLRLHPCVPTYSPVLRTDLTFHSWPPFTVVNPIFKCVVAVSESELRHPNPLRHRLSHKRFSRRLSSQISAFLDFRLSTVQESWPLVSDRPTQTLGSP